MRDPARSRKGLPMTTSKDPAPEPHDATEQASEAAVAAAAQQAVLFEQALKLPQEVTRFCAHRMSRDLETMQALGRCRTPADLVNVWTEAAQTAAEDYRDEMTRVMELVTNGASKESANGASRPRKK
jgi:hypothetical protein